MYQVSVRQHFDAAHALRGYQGKCENLHGHRFEVAVRLRTEKLDDLGLAYDFVELKRHLSEILTKWDHHSLNNIPPFDSVNPSSENIAAAVYKELQTRLDKAVISSVQVWESPDCSATYFPGKPAE